LSFSISTEVLTMRHLSGKWFTFPCFYIIYLSQNVHTVVYVYIFLNFSQEIKFYTVVSHTKGAICTFMKIFGMTFLGLKLNS